MKQQNLKRRVIEQRAPQQKWLPGALALALCAGTVQTSFAQRTADDKQQNRTEQRAARQQAFQNMTPEQRQQFFQQRMQQRQQQMQQQWNAMTPEQRQQFTQQMEQRADQRADQQVASEMQAAGITDPETMDAIKQFVADQRTARKPLLAMAKKIATSLGVKTTADEATTASLADFRKAVAADQARYDKALKDLDAKIGYSTNPKLEAFLTLIGVLGNESSAVGGANAIFPNPMGGFGRGGFGGGGFGGGGNGGPGGGFGGGNGGGPGGG